MLYGVFIEEEGIAFFQQVTLETLSFLFLFPIWFHYLLITSQRSASRSKNEILNSRLESGIFRKKIRSYRVKREIMNQTEHIS